MASRRGGTWGPALPTTIDVLLTYIAIIFMCDFMIFVLVTDVLVFVHLAIQVFQVRWCRLFNMVAPFTLADMSSWSPG